RDQIRVLLRVLINLVEELVESDEARPLDVPVSLLGLLGQIDAIGQALLKQSHHLSSNLLRQIVLGLVHHDVLRRSATIDPPRHHAMPSSVRGTNWKPDPMIRHRLLTALREIEMRSLTACWSGC